MNTTNKMNVQRTNRHTDAIDYCTTEEALNDLKKYWGDGAKYLLKGRLMFTDDNDYQLINL
jgi:hypothetical protein